jgi:hypothetical protein
VREKWNGERWAISPSDGTRSTQPPQPDVAVPLASREVTSAGFAPSRLVAGLQPADDCFAQAGAAELTIGIGDRPMAVTRRPVVGSSDA